MKKNNIFSSILTLCIIILLIIVRNKIYLDYIMIRRLEFRIEISLLIPLIITTISIGLFLGLRHYLQERQKTGRWYINYFQLFVLGIPTLYISFIELILRIDVPNLYNLSLSITRVLDNTSFALFQVLYGYLLITSFSKTTNTNSME